MKELTETGLERFLAEAHSSGSFEATSDFTINTLKARHKLASAQLPGDGLWLVKLVQAAVSCGASRAEIRFGKREVKFHFEVENWSWEPRKLLHDLLSGVLPKEPALFHLFAGLRGSLFEDTVQAEWRISTGEKRFRAKFHGGGTEVREEVESGKPGFWLVTSRPPRWPGFKRAAYTPVKHLLRRTADEFMAVQSYCWTCPIPLFLDGRRLENRYVPSLALDEDGIVQRAFAASHLGSYEVRPVVLAKRELSGRLPLWVRWEEDPGKTEECEFEGHTLTLKRRAYFGQTWLNWPDPEGGPTGAVLLVLFGAQRESRIEFVCDGAVVSHERLPWSSANLRFMGKSLPANQFKVSLTVLVPVTAEELDLSHFNVRGRDERREHWKTRLAEPVTQTCEAILANSKKFWPELTTQPESVLSKITSGYMRMFMAIHPVFVYLRTHGFRRELKSLLRSVAESED